MSAAAASSVEAEAAAATAAPRRGPRRFAVIGAGAAGLCAAKHLVQSGFEDVTIFEIGTEIGGLWKYQNDNGRSAAYRTLHINTARNLTQFSDWPFAPDVQTFPSHEDMHAYLVSYAGRFDLVRRIRFRSRVASVTPAPGYAAGDPKWEIRLENGAVETFDRVIVASGHLSVPMHVPEYRDRFEGEYLHAIDYREPNRFVGKKTVVVGVGNSACDIASDICVTATGTTLVARSGVMIGPKLIFGYAFTDITMKLCRWWIPDRLRRRIISTLVHLVHGRMTDLGFKPLTERAHPTTNAVVVPHIAYRRITVKQGIERCEGRRIYFTDGTSDVFDVMIACTGYLIDLPFVPESVLPVRNNTVELYKRTCVPDWPGLYFMGMYNTTTALNLIFERQAKWICAYESGQAALPDPQAMRDDIAAKQAWIGKHYKPSLRHTIEEEHLYYLQELDRSEKEGRRRRARGGAGARRLDSPPSATSRGR